MRIFNVIFTYIRTNITYITIKHFKNTYLLKVVIPIKKQFRK